jgi:uncharacterized protein (TIGR00730 family)
MQKETPTETAAARPAPRKTRPKHNICVYCGSGPGTKPMFAEAARALGGALAAADIGLVYGGGSRGLMGEVARATLAAGGYVSGIIPDFLYGPEQALADVQDLVVVKSMHHRKQEMYERSDAFIALPGGVGTLEELVEQLTWAQIGHHAKPIAVVDTGGYWQPFVTLIGHMRENAFIRPGLEVELIVAEEPAAVLAAVRKRLGVTLVQTEKLIMDQM